MRVTNTTTQDYWFGPLHLAAGNGSFIDVDDLSSTSLYLSDDSVADAINTLSASGKVNVSNLSTGVLFPRPTGTPEVLHGDGSPEGIVYAGQGSLYLRRDSGSLYTKKTGIHLNTGWSSIAQGSITTTSAWSNGPPPSPGDGDIWIAAGVDSNGTRWSFQYNAGSASSYKWEFLGGGELYTANNTANTFNSAGWTRIATVAISRAGEYLIRSNMSATMGAAAQVESLLANCDNNGSLFNGNNADSLSVASGDRFEISTELVVTSAGTSLDVVASGNGPTQATVNRVVLSATPRRIS